MPEAASAGLTTSSPAPRATIGAAAGGGNAAVVRHCASSASHSKPGPVATDASPARWRRIHVTTAFSRRPAGPEPVRHAPWPPQNQIILCGTRLRRRIASLRTASLGVNSVSAVPWRISAGTRTLLTSASAGPRESNHARSSALKRPVVRPEAKAEVMCGSSVPGWTPAGEIAPSIVAVGAPAP